jgi:Domain of unknown function (DUF1998)
MNQAISKTKVGDLRPSQILFSGGIGAAVDLPNLSAIVMGLDDWDMTYATELGEDRLLAAVKRGLNKPSVKRLMSPPVAPDSKGISSPLDEAAKIGVPIAPFPTWMLCPSCRLLAPLQSKLFDLKIDRYRADRTRYIHTNCSKSKYPPTVVPARFMVACKHGHLDDFPWNSFINHVPGCDNGRLRLFEYGVSGSAADIEVKCETCHVTRRMSDAFGEQGKHNLPQCRGRNVHLRNFEADGCTQQMIAISLGASNSWFPITLSALSIPTSENKLEQLVDKHWVTLEKAVSIEILQAFRAIGQLKEFSQYSDQDLWSTIERRKSGGEDDENLDVRDLKTPEWQIFSNANTQLNNADFQLKLVAAPDGFEPYFDKVVLVERLREVRALVGFTRIESPGDFAETGEIPPDNWAPISRQDPTWVPAAEVKGEGIFLQFSEATISAWEQTKVVKAYNSDCFEAHKSWRRARNLTPEQNYPGARYILIHSFAHALMRQLSIECGYTAASLRERIYTKHPKEENGPMAGVLIYTSAPDSEGTLGGLVSLGKPNVLGRHIEQALEQMRLCASDPLCAEHDFHQSPATALHGSACHACLFSPETSCERGNKLLDRSVLIPTVRSKLQKLAFFSHLA